jgi:TRAP transporter TAXI family solute receptor
MADKGIGLLRCIGGVAALLAGIVLNGVPLRAQDAEIALRCAPFGSIMYVLGNAIQDMTRRDLKGLDVINSEGPGSTAATVNMLRQEAWRQSIGCTSLLDYAYAEKGVAPFFKEPVPGVRKDIKILFNGFYGAIGILSTDPAVKTARDLNGKRLALGKISQAHWGGLPKLFFQAGLPDVKVNMEFMGTDPSHDAMAEGRVESVITQLVVSPDGSHAFKPGVVTQLFASGRKIHLVGFKDEDFQKAASAGVAFRPVQINSKAVPEAEASGAVNWVFSPAALGVHKDFPEETAYKITKFVIENAAKFPEYDAMLAVIASREGLLGDWTAADLHPGAARAFRETGALK